MQFRSDINGLRAIAVLAVVLFHFNPSWLPGGFAGVDVFFVISGFLMTAIIFNGLEKNNFSLFKFYTARANRIIPVLAMMGLVMLVFGWFYLLPPDYRDLGRQVEKSAYFTTNIVFSKGGGYFDTHEKTKWLLHTWSLSVEWQFYIFFPILILILKKYLTLAKIKLVVVGLFVISFLYCIYATFKDSKTAYFLLTSRAWEMLLGGLAFLYPFHIKDKYRLLTQYLGLVLIVLSYFFISERTPWPGYMALIPVVGAYFIIISQQQKSILINNVFFQAIGKWSYSIYVWHWPLVVLGIYFMIPNWWLYGIPLSILFGFLSYRFIETIQFKKYDAWKDIYKVKPFYLFLLLIISGYSVKASDGLKFHYSEEVLNPISEVENINPYECDTARRKHVFEECLIGNQQNVQALVIGDSHADALITAVADVFDLKTQGIVGVTTSGCPFVSDLKFHDPKSTCYALNQQRLALITSEKYKDVPVILISRLTSYIEGQNDPARTDGHAFNPMIYYGDRRQSLHAQVYADTLHNMKQMVCQIRQTNPVYIMQPVPEMPFNVPQAIARDALLNTKTDMSFSYQDYLDRSAKVRDIFTQTATHCDAKTLEPTDILCPAGACMTTYKGRPIYRDGDHLSEYGNKLLVPMFKQISK